MSSLVPPGPSRADMTESKRLFMALPIPTPIRQLLKDFQKPLQATDLPVKWQSGKLLHLTLAFLGQQPADRVQDLTTILENVSREARRFPLQLETLGAFPSFGHPQILWMGVKPSQALMRLQFSLIRELSLAGYETEPREFQPHITIGRCPHALSRPQKQAIQRMLATPCSFGDKGGWEADRMHLYESRTDEHGLHYTPLSGMLFPEA